MEELDVDASTADTSRARREARAHIVAVAAQLLAGGGRDAVSTRAVAAAAGTQAPTIYRLFGDKDGLLDAVAEYGFASYMATKRVRPLGNDPVANLRAGWGVHVGFGLANPALYALMYSDPRPGRTSPAAATAFRVLQLHIRGIASAGRLKLSEHLAADLVHAAGCGTVMTLLAIPENRRDMTLSEVARDAALAAITTDAPPPQAPGPITAANALRAGLTEITMLTDGERHLMQEWLDRIISRSVPNGDRMS